MLFFIWAILYFIELRTFNVKMYSLYRLLLLIAITINAVSIADQNGMDWVKVKERWM